MATGPASKSKRNVGSSASLHRNNVPTRLDIPTTALTPSSSAPSSLSPLVVPAQASNGQMLTNELKTAICASASGRITPQPFESDSSGFSRDDVLPLDDDSTKINSAHLQELEKLGEGSGGTVTKVYNTATKVLMAKKKINVDPNIHKQLLREIRFISKCHSPNIVTYYGAQMEDDNSSISILMEFCEGGSLDVIYKHVNQRQGTIGEPILGKIGESVLKGLVYLYEQHIIHRDIKPSNILVTRLGEIKICDFGVSGYLESSSVNTFLGTSYYMAPERIKGQKYKVSADVWSLGLTIMEVAQNKFPYPTVAPIELVAHIVNLPAPVLGDDYEWSSELRDFLNVCLEKDGEKRPTPRQMLDHPFIQKSSSREVPLRKWIKEVWEWDD
ncbi:11913_t:CDS:2 [Cetraspora pellucida]|uniref:11913_t:CDS:1 n=1 Tax=Cetraspora pellucida TaxID=1433469 RepID=A0ACA9K2B2_9GLOM|nr:11913_t:CDS:2 [Cetraspora pellucida]